MSKILRKKVSVFGVFLVYPAFGLNTERYGVSLRIQSECKEMLTLITPNADTFDAVIVFKNKIIFILE